MRRSSTVAHSESALLIVDDDERAQRGLAIAKRTPTPVHLLSFRLSQQVPRHPRLARHRLARGDSGGSARGRHLDLHLHPGRRPPQGRGPESPQLYRRDRRRTRVCRWTRERSVVSCRWLTCSSASPSTSAWWIRLRGGSLPPSTPCPTPSPSHDLTYSRPSRECSRRSSHRSSSRLQPRAPARAASWTGPCRSDGR